jgi:hypothetical protein
MTLKDMLKGMMGPPPKKSKRGRLVSLAFLLGKKKEPKS